MSDVQIGALVGQLRMDMGNFMSDVNKATKAALGCEKQLHSLRRASLLAGRALDTMGRRAVQTARQIGLTTNSLDRLEDMIVRQANTSNLVAGLTVQNFANMKNGVRRHVVEMTKDVNTLRNETFLLRHAGKGVLIRGGNRGNGFAQAADHVARLQWGLKEVSSWLNRIATASFVMAANIGLASAAIGRMVFVTSKAAADLGELENKFRVLFKDATEDTARQIKEISRQMGGFSETELKQSATLFAGILQNVGLTNQELGQMSANLASIAVDIGSLYNISNQAAMEKLASALSGEIEPGREIGIIVDEATVKNAAKAMGIMNSELSQQVKTMIRYQLIVEATKNTQGDFARTINELTNQVKLLQSDFKDLMRELGLANTGAADIVGRVREIIRGMKEFVQNNRELVTQIMLTANRIAIVGIALVATLVLVPLLAQSLNLLVNTMRLVVFVGAQVNVMLAAMNVRLAATNSQALLMIGKFVRVAALIGALGYILKKSIDVAVKSMNDLGYKITLWDELKATIAGIIPGLLFFAKTMIKAGLEVGQKFAYNIAAAAYFAYNVIVDWVSKVPTLLSGLGDAIVRIVAGIMAVSKEEIKAGFADIGKIFSEFASINSDRWGPKAFKFAEDLVGVPGELATKFETEFDRVQKVVGDWFTDTGKFIGIWAKEAGKQVGSIAAEIGKDFAPMLKKMQQLIADSLSPDQESGFSKLFSALKDAYWRPISESIGEEAKISLEGFREALDRIKNSTREYDEVMAKAGITTGNAIEKNIENWRELIAMAIKARDAVGLYAASVKMQQELLAQQDAKSMPTLRIVDAETSRELYQQIMLYQNLQHEAMKAGDALVWEQATQALDELNSRTLVLNNSMQKLAQTGGKVFRGLTTGMQNFARQGLNVASAVSAGFENVANTFSSSLTENIYAAITGAISLKEAFRNVTMTVLESLAKTAIQIAVNYALASALSSLFMAQLGAEAMILAGLWNPAAILASIATLGAAAAIGSSAVTAALGTGMATNLGMRAGAAPIAGGATGLDTIPKTGVYRLHPGEKVQPAYDAVKSRQEREGGAGNGMGIVAILPESEVLKVMGSARGQKQIQLAVVSGVHRNTEMRRM